MQNEPPKLDAEARRLLGVKGLTVGLLLALALSSGVAASWPLNHWDVFSRGEPMWLREATAIELHVTDAAGQTHILRSYDLYTLDDDFSYQRSGRTLVDSAFGEADSPARMEQTRAHLIDRTEAVLNREVVEIQGWQSVWTVVPTRYPPILPDNPDSITLVDQFRATYYDLNPPDTTADITFGDQLALLGFALPDGAEAQPCQPLYVRSWWQAARAPAANYQITMVLADEAGVGRAAHDGALADQYTLTWQPGHTALDRRWIGLPCDLPAGDYNLLVSLYDVNTTDSLPVTAPAGMDTYAYLTTITVRDSEAGS